MNVRNSQLNESESYISNGRPQNRAAWMVKWQQQSLWICSFWHNNYIAFGLCFCLLRHQLLSNRSKREPKIKRRCSRIVKKKPLVFIHHFLINALNWMRNRTIRSVNEFSCSFHLSLLHFPENLVLNLRTSCEFQFKVVEKRAQFNICTHHYSVSRKYLRWIPGFYIQNILWYREQCFAGNECVNNWK